MLFSKKFLFYFVFLFLLGIISIMYSFFVSYCDSKETKVGVVTEKIYKERSCEMRMIPHPNTNPGESQGLKLRMVCEGEKYLIKIQVGKRVIERKTDKYHWDRVQAGDSLKIKGDRIFLYETK